MLNATTNKLKTIQNPAYCEHQENDEGRYKNHLTENEQWKPNKFNF